MTPPLIRPSGTFSRKGRRRWNRKRSEQSEVYEVLHCLGRGLYHLVEARDFAGQDEAEVAVGEGQCVAPGQDAEERNVEG